MAISAVAGADGRGVRARIRTGGRCVADVPPGDLGAWGRYGEAPSAGGMAAINGSGTASSWAKSIGVAGAVPSLRGGGVGADCGDGVQAAVWYVVGGDWERYRRRVREGCGNVWAG